MKHYITTVLGLAGMAFGIGQADAATLGLTTEAPILSSSSAFVDYLEVATDGDFSTFGAEVDSTEGVSPTGLTEIGFGIGFSLADPTSGPTGGFDVFDEEGLFLDGELLAVGFAEDIVELQFGNLGGSGAGSFGSSVLALIAFDDPLGANPFDAFVDGDFYSASITILSVVDDSVAPVPLPASLPLLLIGMSGIALLRGRPKA